MDKNQVIYHLHEKHDSFTKLIVSLDERSFLFTINDKWTPGQQAKHILRSIEAVHLGFSLPKFFLRICFGKAKRPSKTFEALVEKYKSKLAAGGRASGRFIPPPVVFNDKQKIATSISTVNNSICKKVAACTEDQLDTYILPHPLLGKITFREMLYFNIHHAAHHEKTVRQLLEK